MWWIKGGLRVDYDQIARIEKAIAKKYGNSAIINPKSNWDDEKEKSYLKDKKKKLKEDETIVTKVEYSENSIELDELKQTTERECTICTKYSFYGKDDLYMNKYKCCEKCYIIYVEGRTQKWLSGWRPDKIKS